MRTIRVITVVFMMMFFSVLNANAYTYWQELDIGIETEPIWDMWGSSADDIWAIGYHGTTIHYDGTWVEIDDNRGV